jgi:hypothetical protein
MSVPPPMNFLWGIAGKVATITLNRPERKNPLTFESYAELRPVPCCLASSVRGALRSYCTPADP